MSSASSAVDQTYSAVNRDTISGNSAGSNSTLIVIAIVVGLVAFAWLMMRRK